MNARSTIATLHIATPEGVAFALPLAGPITRAMALAVDLVVMLAIGKVLSLAMGILRAVSNDAGAAGMLLSQFLISFGYGSICELLFNGQTIGKRVLGIRVMDERGLRLRPSQVIIRNLLRIVDMLPFLYAVGGIFCLLSRRNQRVGDLAAGTVVVRTVKATPPDIEGLLGGKYNSFRQHPHLEARLRQKITPDEAQLALAALVRREELQIEAVIQIFGEMATRFRSKVKFPEETVFGLSDEQYVRNVVDTLYRQSGKA
ncbi:MAG: domain containing protein [Verrucomicrobiaceae bacterium]|nr:domain containing protein [Verrucomicrobiaceae bacterium]